MVWSQFMVLSEFDLNLKKLKLTQGQRLRLNFNGKNYMFTIEEIIIIIDGALDVVVYLWIVASDLRLKVTPDEIYVMKEQI